MTGTKYGKYIITEKKGKIYDAPWIAEYKPEELTGMLGLDSEVIEGAFFVGSAWFWPPVANRTGRNVRPHKHDYDEVLAQFGTNFEDPNDLCGEMEIWLDDEKHIITKSSLIFIPKGLKHGPIKWNRVDRPIFQFGVHTGKKYFKEKKHLVK